MPDHDGYERSITMTDLNKNTPAELNDEELDQVVGGVSIGTRCSARVTVSLTARTAADF